MQLNLTRPLLFFDIESTGLNIPADSIIELSFVKVFPGGEERIKTWRIKPWKVAGESFNFNSLYSAVEIVVPSEYSVWINGTRLGEECITETGIHYDFYEEYYKYWDYLPTKVRYRYDHVIGQVEPEIRDEDGNTVHLDESAGDSQFLPTTPEDFYQRCVEFAVPFTKAYLTYISGVPDLVARLKVFEHPLVQQTVSIA